MTTPVADLLSRARDAIPQHRRAELDAARADQHAILAEAQAHRERSEAETALAKITAGVRALKRAARLFEAVEADGAPARVFADLAALVRAQHSRGRWWAARAHAAGLRLAPPAPRHGRRPLPPPPPRKGRKARAGDPRQLLLPFPVVEAVA